MADADSPRDGAPASHSLRVAGVSLFVAAMVLLGAVHSAYTGSNVNTRLALVYAVVDRGTFAIDGYHGRGELFETSDKATFNGHFYSDKAFGLSLLCIPVYAAMQALAHTFGFEWHLQIVIYLLRMWSSSIPAALSLVVLWDLLVRAGATPRRAFVAVPLVFCGSLWFPYATLAFPYSLGILACLVAVHRLLYPPTGALRERDAAVIGLLCGFALICDFLFGLVVLALVVVFIGRLVPLAWPGRIRLGLVGAACGVLPVMVFFTYTYWIFGRPGLPYEYEALPQFREGMQAGFMGIKAPQLGPLWYLTIHPFRGVFFWSSWLLLALVGGVLGMQSSGIRRTWGWLTLWAIAAYVLTSSSYYMWWGGGTMGARLTTPMLALAPMGLAEICRRDRGQGWWRAVVVTGALSMALIMPVALINPQTEEMNPHEVLYDVPFGTPLQIPQFVSLSRYYSGDWFWGPQSRDHFLRVLPLLAMCGSVVILRRAYRRLPE